MFVDFSNTGGGKIVVDAYTKKECDEVFRTIETSYSKADVDALIEEVKSLIPKSPTK